MSRIRTIKPEFFTSSDIVEMTPLARLFYVSLWCESDRDGRLNWNLKTLKMRYLPADDCNIEGLSNELIAANLISIYVVSGRQYAQIHSFTHHQVINNREAESIIPDMILSDDASTTRESGVLGEGKGREGKGREGKGREGKGREGGAMPSRLDASRQILEFLNAKTGKAFKPVDSNLNLINARLKEGHAEHEVLAVIERKCSEWMADDKMKQYLRPSTLFNAEKFNAYVGELGVETPEQAKERKLEDWLNSTPPQDDVIEGEILQ